MTAQLDLGFLPFLRHSGRGPKITQAHVDEFIRALYRRGWQTSDALGATTEKQKRLLRAIAAASKGHIISGQAGYRLNFEATADETRTFLQFFRNQIEQMQLRIVSTERVYHAKEIPDCLLSLVRHDRPAS